MPKKRHHAKSFNSLTAAAASAAASSSSASSSTAADKPPKTVNELLTNLRRTAIGSSAKSAQPVLAATTPSVHPAIREILQLPDTPAPAPRRLARQRFDGNGRRLPAGPPPPRSWVARRLADRASSHASSSRSTRLSALDDHAETTLPGIDLPARGSLIDIVLRKLAVDWQFQRVYNQYHLYFVPSHLKSALIRCIAIASEDGLSVADLKAILLPPSGVFDEEEEETLASSHPEVTYLDLHGCVGRSLRLKDVSDLLFPAKEQNQTVEPQESWDTTESVPSPPTALMPNLTHLSLALDPRYASSASWKHLLSLSAKLPSLTHLSLAFWPDPCLQPDARQSAVSSPRGNIPYGGTNIYSHSIDHDWSEALLVLRTLSRNLYGLEFLDLTGCAPWFRSLMLESEHDRVDWAGCWGKITELWLYTGWKPTDDAPRSDQLSYRASIHTAREVEKHIIAARAGQGRFINVERDRLDGTFL